MKPVGLYGSRRRYLFCPSSVSSISRPCRGTGYSLDGKQCFGHFIRSRYRLFHQRERIVDHASGAPIAFAERDDEEGSHPCTAPSSLVLTQDASHPSPDYVAGTIKKNVPKLDFKAVGQSSVNVNYLEIVNLSGKAVSIDHLALRMKGDEEPFAVLTRGVTIETQAFYSHQKPGVPLFTVKADQLKDISSMSF